MQLHEPWLKAPKKQFAEKYFSRIACETIKWTDDSALFIFGYLVREFSQEVLKTKRLEEEIWVVSLFDMTLNIVSRSKH